jgi:Kae1-associated kinase Bud32
MKVIGRGAEAVLYLEEGDLVKERIKKGYRIEELDHMLRKRRTRLESRVLSKAKRAGVPTPTVVKTEEHKIVMEFIEGERLKELFQKTKERKDLAEEVGALVGKLHSAGIIHGDLTTSNMIFRDKIYFIDFGLAFHSHSVEDRAVDLHLLHQAYQSTHFRHLEELWNCTVKGYKETFDGWEFVLKRLEQIRKRGRYAKR